MKIINGIYNHATVYTTNNFDTAIDDYASAQLQMLCDNETSKDCKICVMPDVHPGKVCTIGLTITIGNKIMPNLIGLDAGCGMTLAKLKNKNTEYQKLDTVIREHIPSGFAIRKKAHRFSADFDFTRLHCYAHINIEKAMCSLGTLGGGNHFIELDRDDDKNLYVVIHSGSRRLGREMTEYYLMMGHRALKEKGINVPYELTYLEGKWMEDYLHDLEIVQEFAELNRQTMLDELVKNMKWKYEDSFSCIHNYVADGILRKGAISAKKDEKVIIPINMRDGILLGTGLGNPDWNYSAPHGAGRIMNRENVKQHHTVSEFKSQMKGIYSSCIGKDTLDEAPFAYRSINDIQEVISDTVNITQILRPIFNYKAGGE